MTEMFWPNETEVWVKWFQFRGFGTKPRASAESSGGFARRNQMPRLDHAVWSVLMRSATWAMHAFLE